jgi:RNA polymerase sigma factor (TIGR02999 family)
MSSTAEASIPDRSGIDDMIQSVYGELHQLAAGYVRREKAKSVFATDLIHEAYMRLASGAAPKWNNKQHFVAIAAIAMRRLLVERARARHAAKRGGAQVQVTLDDALLSSDGEAPLVDMIALDRALTSLAAKDPEQARIVELRYFGGLSVEETAEALDSSPATVKRHWTLARAWLLRELEGPSARA